MAVWDVPLTNPQRRYLTSVSTELLAADFTNRLQSGETPNTCTTTLWNTETGEQYGPGLSGSPSISGNHVVQLVSNLPVGKYALVWSMAVSGSSNVYASATLIQVDY